MIYRQRARTSATPSPYSGGTVDDWTNPCTAELPGAVFAPDTAAAQPYVDGRPVEETGSVYRPEGAWFDVTEQDRLLIGGQPWRVDGVLPGYVNPFTGDTAGFVVRVRRVR